MMGQEQYIREMREYKSKKVSRGSVCACGKRELGFCKKPPRGSDRKEAATPVHGPLRKTLETTSHCQSVFTAPHCFSQSCTRPHRGRHLASRQDRSLLPFQMKGRCAVQLCSVGNGIGRACRVMGFAARSCKFGRVLRARSTLAIACDVCFRRARVHRNDFAKSPCDRDRLPWILEHRHTTLFFNDPRL